jgi:hypothetical protein
VDDVDDLDEPDPDPDEPEPDPEDPDEPEPDDDDRDDRDEELEPDACELDSSLFEAARAVLRSACVVDGATVGGSVPDGVIVGGTVPTTGSSGCGAGVVGVVADPGTTPTAAPGRFPAFTTSCPSLRPMSRATGVMTMPAAARMARRCTNGSRPARRNRSGLVVKRGAGRVMAVRTRRAHKADRVDRPYALGTTTAEPALLRSPRRGSRGR